MVFALPGRCRISKSELLQPQYPASQAAVRCTCEASNHTRLEWSVSNTNRRPVRVWSKGFTTPHNSEQLLSRVSHFCSATLSCRLKSRPLSGLRSHLPARGQLQVQLSDASVWSKNGRSQSGRANTGAVARHSLTASKAACSAFPHLKSWFSPSMLSRVPPYLHDLRYTSCSMRPSREKTSVLNGLMV